MKRKISMLLVAVFLHTLMAEAQILTGRLLGVVRDESGALLTATAVTLESPALPGGPIAVVTNERGEFRFIELQPGLYQLSVARPGFRSHVEQDLRVSAGGTIEVKITLAAGALDESLIVKGQSPSVDSRQPGIVRSLPVETVEAIPQNRQGGVMAYMAALPGVTSENYNRIAQVIAQVFSDGLRQPLPLLRVHRH